MKALAQGVLVLLVAVVVAGCASTKVSDREVLVREEIPRPDRILVYEFAATPDEVPADSSLSQHVERGAPQTPEEIEAGRKLGSEIANELAKNIRAMGMTADAVPIGTPLRMDDIVIKGYLASVQKGSEAERLVIGFGKGASELKTVVEGFQLTPQGLRKLGGGTVDAGGGKSPGAALGVAGLVATGNPAGLIVSTGMKLYGEESGKSKLEGRAEATAKEISDQLEKRFREQGWIP